jgi:tetratricopeptide (TPR) repeat protein
MKKQSAIKKYSFEIIVSSLITAIIAIYIAFPPLGQAQVETADALNKKVMSLYHAGEYRTAFPIAMRVLDLREKNLGPDHHDVAVALQTLAGLYEAVGDYKNAAPFDKRALKILEPEVDIEGMPAT